MPPRPVPLTHSLRSLHHPRSFHTSSRLAELSTPSTSSATTPASPSSTPSEIASQFLSKFVTSSPQSTTQLLDPNQLRLFSLTLHRPALWPQDPTSLTTAPPPSGTPLPPAYHLANFTLPQLESQLGADGTDASYNPSPPFTRRMWAGGSISFPGAPKNIYLRVGDTVTETTRVLSCEPKVVKKTGENMLVVGVEKEFLTPAGEVAILDRRNWVFREALDPTNLPTPTPAKPLQPETSLPHDGQSGLSVRKFTQSPVTLFRFSALTFNAHKIHYSLPWCQTVEGHRDLVVHGPMNLINMLDLWRDSKGLREGEYPESIEYRATSPVYAGEPYRVVVGEEGADGVSGCEVVSDDGTVCMKGRIKAFQT